MIKKLRGKDVKVTLGKKEFVQKLDSAAKDLSLATGKLQEKGLNAIDQMDITNAALKAYISTFINVEEVVEDLDDLEEVMDVYYELLSVIAEATSEYKAKQQKFATFGAASVGSNYGI